jgi:hypothetical protein
MPQVLGTIPCTHPDYPGTHHDLSEFLDGAPDVKTGKGGYRWIGGFSGRPELLRDLLPVIRANYSKYPPLHFHSLIVGGLRFLYRFLDAYEHLAGSQGLHPVSRLHHLTASHLDLMSLPGPNKAWDPAPYRIARIIRTLVLDAIQDVGLPPVHVSALIRPRASPKEPPSGDECKSLVRFLRSEVIAIFDRWKRSDALASVGRDLIALRAQGNGRVSEVLPTEADAHATYRSLVTRTGHALPNCAMLNESLGLASRGLPDWWPCYSAQDVSHGKKPGTKVIVTDLAAGLYPTTQDILLCALLCLGRSAWNSSTLFSIDINDWWNQYDEKAAWLFAPKARSGGAYQYTVSRIGERTGVYEIIQALIKRSASLRKWLENHRNAHPTPDIALRSPWLGTNDGMNYLLFTVDPRSDKHANLHLKKVIERHNESPSAKVKIRNMCCRDFRNVAAGWVYRNSRYSTWLAMILLGHKNASTTRTYLYTRAARAESHSAVKTVMDDVFDQVVTSRRWDPVLSRARVEGVDITDEARAKLDLYRERRTYDGSVCRSPTNPPDDIDPKNPRDGKTRCIQGHRCVAAHCPNAIVFKESLPWLARRTAELEWFAQNVGAVRFSTSTDADDLQVLRATLRQWPREEVERELQHWHKQIVDGTHRPLRLAGQHP